MEQFDKNEANGQEQENTPQTTQPQNNEQSGIAFLKTIMEIISVSLKKTTVRVAIAVVAVFIIIIIFASSNNPVQDDLIDYINNDIDSVLALETEALYLYEAAREYSQNDYEMYVMIRDEVLPAVLEWSEAVEDIEVETEEVKAVHEIYIKAVNETYSAMTLILSALENQDYALMTQANEKLDSSRKSSRDFESALEKLMNEHDVVYN